MWGNFILKLLLAKIFWMKFLIITKLSRNRNQSRFLLLPGPISSDFFYSIPNFLDFPGNHSGSEIQKYIVTRILWKPNNNLELTNLNWNSDEFYSFASMTTTNFKQFPIQKNRTSTFQLIFLLQIIIRIMKIKAFHWLSS